MKAGKFEILYLTEDIEIGNSVKYEKVCQYLLEKYFEGCEGYEGFGLSEGINGGSGGERLFHTSTED